MEEIMKFENTLPEDFDGTFRFTNWTDEDFTGTWGKKEYIFPARTTSPIIIISQTPLEIQQIRKKFAKDLAQKVFGSSDAYKRLMLQERTEQGTPTVGSFQLAGTYSNSDLAPYIQKCLIPLEVSRATVVDAPRENLEEKLSVNESGEPNTSIVDRKTSLRKKALES